MSAGYPADTAHRPDAPWNAPMVAICDGCEELCDADLIEWLEDEDLCPRCYAEAMEGEGKDDAEA